MVPNSWRHRASCWTRTRGSHSFLSCRRASSRASWTSLGSCWHCQLKTGDPGEKPALPMEVHDVSSLELSDIQAARRLLGDRVLTTPVHEWEGPVLAELLGP